MKKCVLYFSFLFGFFALVKETFAQQKQVVEIEIILDDKSKVSGIPCKKKFVFLTSNGKLKVKYSDFSKLKFTSNKQNLTLLNNDKFSGQLKCKTIKVQTKNIGKVEIEVSNIVSVNRKNILLNTKGLVASYYLNGNLNDNSGNEYHAKAYGSIDVCEDRSGKFNSAYEFDGVDDYIEIPNLSLNESFTISFWALNEKPFTSKQTLISKPKSWNIGSNDSLTGIEFSMVNSYNEKISIETSQIKSLQWLHYIAIYNSKNGILKLYIKNKLVGTISVKNSNDNKSSIYIGVNHPIDKSSFFKGRIDNLQFFNKVLNETEISYLKQVDK